MESMRPSIVAMEYAVRGQVVVEADKIKEELTRQDGKAKYNFDHIIYTNIGNPHSVGQKPLTWPRQVLTLVDLPRKDGVDHPNVLQLYPEDAVRRANEIKEGLGGCGSGAYSHSQGAKSLRIDVANFIQQRDGVPSNPNDIFLTNGASSAISLILKVLVANQNSGVMIPIPQYPIYSATIDLLAGKKVGYYLNEEKHWAMEVEELERALNEATASGIDVTALVLINPGNPTGQVLSVSADCRGISRYSLSLLIITLNLFFSARICTALLGFAQKRTLFYLPTKSIKKTSTTTMLNL
jgi:aspartate/methionine/tyrosine aminotransferase